MKELFNLTEFSNMIGVSAVTLMNWDANGKLAPVNKVGRTRFYSVEQYCEYQINKLLNDNVKSFLGILVNKTDEALDLDEKVFSSTINAQMGKAKYVTDIREQMVSFINSDSIDISSEAFQDILKDKVLTEYYHTSQIEIGKTVAEQVFSHRELRKLPYSCFIKMACGVPFDEQTLATVKDVCEKASTAYTVLTNTMTTALQEVKRSYGLLSILAESGLSDYDIFNGKTVSLEKVKEIRVDISTGASKALKILKDLQSKAQTRNTSQAIADVFRNGYYTTRKFNITNEMSEEEKLEVFKQVNAGYYKFVYVSHWDYLPSTLQVLLNDLQSRGKIELITPEVSE